MLVVFGKQIFACKTNVKAILKSVINIDTTYYTVANTQVHFDKLPIYTCVFPIVLCFENTFEQTKINNIKQWRTNTKHIHIKIGKYKRDLMKLLGRLAAIEKPRPSLFTLCKTQLGETVVCSCTFERGFSLTWRTEEFRFERNHEINSSIITKRKL